MFKWMSREFNTQLLLSISVRVKERERERTFSIADLCSFRYAEKLEETFAFHHAQDEPHANFGQAAVRNITSLYKSSQF